MNKIVKTNKKLTTSKHLILDKSLDGKYNNDPVILKKMKEASEFFKNAKRPDGSKYNS